jgi:succinate dehydrogenase flavin-adding protein (antitoxin of CptAB toxin-antitoxin module)
MKMKPYATYINVNGDIAYFKDDIFTIASVGDCAPQYYAEYNDGSTIKDGITVQEIKEAISKNMKIVFDYFEQGINNSNRIIGKYFITKIINISDDEIDEYELHYINENNNDLTIIVNFGTEPEPTK